MKWFWDALFLNVIRPLFGIDAGLLAHVVSCTALRVASASGMTLPVSAPAAVNAKNLSGSLVLTSSAQ